MSEAGKKCTCAAFDGRDCVCGALPPGWKEASSSIPPTSVVLFPSEEEAIKLVQECGKRFGYGNMIHHLRQAWADRLYENYGKEHGWTKEQCEADAGFVCPWCRVDCRTGEKAGEQNATG